VAIELKKKYGDDLFYYKKNIEVDFFIPKESQAIQVSYSIADATTYQREITALVKLAVFHKLKKVEVVTFSEETTLQENGVTIQVVPVWKWLLK